MAQPAVFVVSFPAGDTKTIWRRGSGIHRITSTNQHLPIETTHSNHPSHPPINHHRITSPINMPCTRDGTQSTAHRVCGEARGRETRQKWSESSPSQECLLRPAPLQCASPLLQRVGGSGLALLADAGRGGVLGFSVEAVHALRAGTVPCASLEPWAVGAGDLADELLAHWGPAPVKPQFRNYGNLDTAMPTVCLSARSIEQLDVDHRTQPQHSHSTVTAHSHSNVIAQSQHTFTAKSQHTVTAQSQRSHSHHQSAHSIEQLDVDLATPHCCGSERRKMGPQ